jgi:uncharacterized membrane protein YdjX (TVP38/TMEM64 family)
MKRLLYDVRFWFFIAFITLIVGFRFFDVQQYANIATLKTYRDTSISFVHEYYWISVVAFIAVYIIETIFALPIAAFMSIAAGFLFGLLPAVIYIVVAATCGATGSFLLTRYLIGETIQQRYHEKLALFNAEMKAYGVYYLLLLRLIPIVPFFLVNMLSGLTSLHVSVFMLVTAVGIVPGTFLYAYIGQYLQQIDTIQDVFSWQIVLIFLALASFVAISFIVKRSLDMRKVS